MSGVFAVASHSVLQYLPDVVTHEQTGCAHFSVFVGAISFLPTLDQEWMIQTQNGSLRCKLFLYRKEHIAMSLFFATRRRLVFGESVYALAILTAILLAIFREVTDRLIPLYAVGAFMAFTLSQAGMVAHWKRVGGPGAHKGMFLNGLGASATAITVAIVLVAKFTDGAWITLVLIPAMILMMSVIKRHYGRVEKETQTDRSPCIAPRRSRFCQSVAAPSSGHRVRWFWWTLGNKRLSISRVSLAGSHESRRRLSKSEITPALNDYQTYFLETGKRR